MVGPYDFLPRRTSKSVTIEGCSKTREGHGEKRGRTDEGMKFPVPEGRTRRVETPWEADDERRQKILVEPSKGGRTVTRRQEPTKRRGRERRRRRRAVERHEEDEGSRPGPESDAAAKKFM